MAPNAEFRVTRGANPKTRRAKSSTVSAMASGEPTVSSKGLRPPFFTAAARLQRPVPELAASVGVPLSLLTDVSARVPHSTVVRVWDGLAERCEDPCFGLTAASLVGAPQVDLVDIAFARAPTLRALCESLCRYQRLFHDANRVSVLSEREHFIVRHAFSRPLSRSRHFTEFILAMWTARLGGALGPRIGLSSVSFRHDAPADVSAARKTFACSVSWGAEHDQLSAPIAFLDEPLHAGDAALVGGLEGQLDAELDALGDAEVGETVRRRVVQALRASESIDLDVIARRLALSSRTLQRRLRLERTSYRDVVDEARREIAVDVLARGSDATDVAFLLGFSELSAFSRAFRRWTGATPAAWGRERAV